MACSSAAATTDELVIPMNIHVNMSNNLSVYLTQVTISNVSIYNTYSKDAENTTWVILNIIYENHGKGPNACRFHVQIVDNSSKVPAGWNYDKTDESLFQTLSPGQNSPPAVMEFAMLKGRILTNLSVIDDTIHKEVANIPIVYPTPTPSPTPASVPGLFDEGGENLRNLMLIPILLGLVGLVGWFMARRRLF